MRLPVKVRLRRNSVPALGELSSTTARRRTGCAARRDLDFFDLIPNMLVVLIISFCSAIRVCSAAISSI